MSLPGSNTLLCGGTGTGKTYSVRTLRDAGVTPFVIFTEPGMRTLGDLPDVNGECAVHWHYVKPATVGFDDLLDNAKKIATMSYKALTGLTEMNKAKYQQFMTVLSVAHNFTCDKCGKEFGPVDEWGPDRAIVLDSLTGLSKMAMDLVVGAKPVKNPGDWGVAMDNLARLLDKFAEDTQCHYVLISHLEREKDEITGAVKNMPSTLGQKLAPKIPLVFDDVVLCKQVGNEFVWSTVDPNTELKNRNLPHGDKLPPSFVQIIESWKSAGGSLEAQAPAA